MKFAPLKMDALSQSEIEAGNRMQGAVSLEARFLVSSLEDALDLSEALFEAEFLCVKPSNKISEVRIVRPSEDQEEIAIIANTGSQKVPVEQLTLFHEEIALFAAQQGCEFDISDVLLNLTAKRSSYHWH